MIRKEASANGNIYGNRSAIMAPFLGHSDF